MQTNINIIGIQWTAIASPLPLLASPPQHNGASLAIKLSREWFDVLVYTFYGQIELSKEHFDPLMMFHQFIDICIRAIPPLETLEWTAFSTLSSGPCLSTQTHRIHLQRC